MAITKSPFYKGRTTYGGASAYSKLKYFRSTTDNNVSCRNTIQIKPNKESKTTDKTSLSKTARRILETLEQYTSPLAETKKIPLPTIRRTSLRDPLRSTYAHPYTNREKVTNRELQVPTVPDLLKMKLKERLQDSTVCVRELANTSKSELNKREYTIKSNEDELSKHTNKMKTKITSTRTCGNKQTVEHLEEVELPNIQLPITTLPKFDFNVTNPINAHVTKTVERNVTSETQQSKNTISKTSNVAENLKSTTNNSIFASHASKNNVKAPPICIDTTSNTNFIATPNHLQFKFSKPIVIATNMKFIKAINNYKFSEPITTMLDDSSAKVTLKKKHNGDNTLQVQTAKELIKTGSVIDVLGKNDLAEKFKPPEGTWECSVCMIRNKAEDDRCAACTTKRANDHRDTNVDLNKFKLTAEKWECTTCMVRNNNSDSKCVACTAPKPVVNGSLSSKKSSAKTSDLATLFKPPTNTWECGVCMIRNKEETTKCAACESSRPQPANNTNKFDLVALFKPPTNTWECGVCMIRNKEEASKCAACETPNPLSKSTFGGAFKKKENEWECSSCMVRNTPDNTKCVCCDTARPGAKKMVEIEIEPKKIISTFNFGIDNNAFSFGIKPVDNKPSEKSNEALKGFVFGAPSTATSTSETPSYNFGVPNDMNKDVQNKDFVFGVQNDTKTTIATESADKTKLACDVSKTSETTAENISNGPTFSFGNTSHKDADKTDSTKKIAILNPQENSLTSFKFGNNETSANIQFGATKWPVTDSEPTAKRKNDSMDNVTDSKLSFFDRTKTSEQNKESNPTYSFGNNNPKRNSAFGANKEDATKFGTSTETSTFAVLKEPPAYGATKTTVFGTSKDVPTFGGSKSTSTFTINNDAPTFGGASKDTSTFGGNQNNSIFGSSNPTATFDKSKTSTAFTTQKSTTFTGKESGTFGSSNSAFGSKQGTFGSKEATFGSKEATFGSKEGTFGSKEGTFGSKEGTTFGSKGGTAFSNMKEAPVFGKSTTFVNPKSNFTFNAATTTQNANVFNATANQQASLFSFGANNKTNTTTTGEAPQSTTSNIFGASNTNIYGTANQQQQQQSSGTNEEKTLPPFSFTNPKAQESTSNPTIGNSNLFTFGSASAGTSDKTANFNFNTNQPNPDLTSKSLFNPSQQQQQQQQQANPFDNNPINGGFVFTQTKTPKSGFNFGNSTNIALPPQPSSIFSFGTNTTDNVSFSLISQSTE